MVVVYGRYVFTAGWGEGPQGEEVVLATSVYTGDAVARGAIGSLTRAEGQVWVHDLDGPTLTRVQDMIVGASA